MNALFALDNRASAEQIRARLANPPTGSSVRVMLARLETKGLIKHEVAGPRFLYSSTISTSAARRAALQQYVRTFFGGSLTQMAAALFSDASWSDEDLDFLHAEIDRARKDRTRPR